MNPAIGYIRVSTGKQAEKGLSLEDQRNRIGAWCANTERIACCFEDRRSGRKAIRRRVLVAVQTACDLKAPFVVWSVDRFARNAEDALRMARRLNEAGAGLVILKEGFDSTTAAGRMMFGIMAVLAEWFSAQLSERMQEDSAYRREQGLRYSIMTPYGKRLTKDGRLEPDVEELKTLHQIRCLRTGGWSYGKIATWLEANEHRTKSGKARWSKRLVKTLYERSDVEKALPVQG